MGTRRARKPSLEIVWGPEGPGKTTPRLVGGPKGLGLHPKIVWGPEGPGKTTLRLVGGPKGPENHPSDCLGARRATRQTDPKISPGRQETRPRTKGKLPTNPKTKPETLIIRRVTVFPYWKHGRSLLEPLESLRRLPPDFSVLGDCRVECRFGYPEAVLGARRAWKTDPYDCLGPAGYIWGAPAPPPPSPDPPGYESIINQS